MSFSEASLVKKLQDLTNTQQSVQTLSLWLIHHRKHAKTIVQVWLKELLSESKCEQKITFMYLANDILQNSRKKGMEYMQEFVHVLYEAIQNIALQADDKVRFTIERILNIWKDRKLFTDEVLDKFRQILHNPSKKIEINTDDNILRSPVATQQNQSQVAAAAAVVDGTNTSPNENLRKRKLISQLKDELFSSSEALLDFKAPEASELIVMLQDLEKSASSDANVRQKIADLPSAISDLNSISKISTRHEALELDKQVKDAVDLLDDYNKRLQDELINRKKIALLLNAFIKQQQNEMENDKQILNDWRQKSKNTQTIENELDVHAKNLPDLTAIDEAAQLIPLPSPNDLFS